MNYNNTEFIEKKFKWTSNVLIWTTGYDVMSVVQMNNSLNKQVWMNNSSNGSSSNRYPP